MSDFEKIDLPQGRFIGWGEQGQKVTVRVVSYDPNGGTDFNGGTCPQLVGELTEPAINYRDKGATKETLAAGELVTVTAGIANLKRGLLAADPHPGDIVRMEFTGTYATGKGTGKVIEVSIARAPVTAPVAIDAD